MSSEVQRIIARLAQAQLELGVSPRTVMERFSSSRSFLKKYCNYTYPWRNR